MLLIGKARFKYFSEVGQGAKSSGQPPMTVLTRCDIVRYACMCVTCHNTRCDLLKQGNCCEVAIQSYLMTSGHMSTNNHSNPSILGFHKPAC